MNLDGARRRLGFLMREVSGSLGDIGTLFPLLAGMVLAGSASMSGTLIWFGFFTITTGIVFGIPLAVQPMKVIASLSITQKLPPETLVAAGIILGVSILLLSQTRVLKMLQERLPKAVIVGIQVTLGLQLVNSALTMMAGKPLFGLDSVSVGVVSLAIILLSLKFRSFPAALLLTVMGLAMTVVAYPQILHNVTPELSLPPLVVPSYENFVKGAELAVAQIPLTVTNSLLATVALGQRFFPRRSPTIRSVALNLSAMNLVAPLFGGVPMCHGAGGMASWHRFGARTAASMLMFGTALTVAGLLFGNFALTLMQAFPLTILAAMLLSIGVQFTLMIRESLNASDLMITAATVAVSILFSILLGLAAGFLCSVILKKVYRGEGYPKPASV
ncbi:MAG: putative sulfate/molybdate transporter [Candidatus Bathyarchaeota archaeon]|nr:putative sulfate/molybdate transporter [Candidatus Bathyarchaeota archaeon]